jgi:hypothetical protein
MQGLSLRFVNDFSWTSLDADIGYKEKSISWDGLLGPAFYTPLTEYMYPFFWAYGGLGVGKSSGEREDGDSESSQKRYAIGVEPGLAFVFGPFYARLAAGYKRLWVRDNLYETDGDKRDQGDENWNRFYARFGLGIFFGL